MAKHKSARRLIAGFLAPLAIAAISTAIPHLLGMENSVVPILGMAAGLIIGAVLVTSYAFKYWLTGSAVISAYFLFVGLGIWFIGMAVGHFLGGGVRA